MKTEAIVTREATETAAPGRARKSLRTSIKAGDNWGKEPQPVAVYCVDTPKFVECFAL